MTNFNYFLWWPLSLLQIFALEKEIFFCLVFFKLLREFFSTFFYSYTIVLSGWNWRRTWYPNVIRNDLLSALCSYILVTFSLAFFCRKKKSFFSNIHFFLSRWKWGNEIFSNDTFYCYISFFDIVKYLSVFTARFLL